MSVISKIKRIYASLIGGGSIQEFQMIALGRLLSNQQCFIVSDNLNDYEFKIFSEYGDDGIIQYLIKNIEIKNKIFIEFGVQDYMESNTRFLMMNNNWSGLVMDGSKEAIDSLRRRTWFWRYDLETKAVFIDKDNINTLLSSPKYTDIGILCIDIDGNDYHILEAIDMKKLNPSILIMEYNSVFGSERKITVPYDKKFFRTNAHYSNLYFGASLAALADLANKKGYALVCCNSAGNNSYFVRKDLLTDKIRERKVEEVYVKSKTRESRDKHYNLSLLSGDERYEAIKGLDILNIETGKLEVL